MAQSRLSKAGLRPQDGCVHYTRDKCYSGVLS